MQTEEVAAPPPIREAHSWVVSEFLDWLDRGPIPATNLDDNIRTAAMIFGAIEGLMFGAGLMSGIEYSSRPNKTVSRIQSYKESH